MNEGNATKLPWVIFEKKNRSNCRIVNAVSYPEALEIGADRLDRRVTEVDYAPVIEGETAEQAKARVAGSIG